MGGLPHPITQIAMAATFIITYGALELTGNIINNSFQIYEENKKKRERKKELKGEEDVCIRKFELIDKVLENEYERGNKKMDIITKFETKLGFRSDLRDRFKWSYNSSHEETEKYARLRTRIVDCILFSKSGDCELDALTSMSKETQNV